MELVQLCQSPPQGGYFSISPKPDGSVTVGVESADHRWVFVRRGLPKTERPTGAQKKCTIFSASGDGTFVGAGPNGSSATQLSTWVINCSPERQLQDGLPGVAGAQPFCATTAAYSI